MPKESSFSREAALRYRALFEQSPDGILIIDIDGKIIEFNEAAHTQLGYSRDEFAKLSIFDLEAIETPEQIQASIKRVLEAGTARFVANHRARDGEIRETEVITRAMSLGGRTVFHTVWRDVTERRKAEERLQQSEEKYRDLFENAMDAIFIVDADLNYIDVNRRAVELFGYSRDEFLSMNILDVIPREQVPRSRAEFEKLRRTGTYEKFEGKFRKKDGVYLDIEVSSSAIYEDGKIVGSRDIVRDVTARKQAETALRRAKEELEERVRERTRELADSNRELRTEIDERAKAESRLREAKGLSDTVNAINAIIHSTLDFDAIMQSVVIEAAKAVEVDVASIGLFEDDVFMIRHTHTPSGTCGGQPAVPVDVKGIRYAASVRDVVAFNEAENDERLDRELIRKSGIRATLIAPLIVKENILGAMVFSYCRRGPGFADPAIDFIRKLSASVSLALENARLYRDRSLIEENMRHMAHHDPLTGLPNRRLLMDIINFKLAEIRRNRKKLGVLFLDLDRFKEINDTLGHEAGDELLRQVAERLKSGIRETDAIARIGGDEFNIIVGNVGRPEDITPIARKVMSAFREPYTVSGHELTITTSIGISVYPDDSDEVNTLFRYADIAMYYAKEAGKNRYHFYNPSVNVRSFEKIKLENYLRHTLERRQLVVHYQPQVDIKTGEIVCAEALVRWQHPERGLLDSKQFILAAEETGFIGPIDRWVFRTVCDQLKAWRDAGVPAPRVSVNLSARAFQNPDLVDFVSSVLHETGFPPQFMEIEVTESTAMSDIEHSITQLRKLAGMGLRIAIDDFGIGYSSLNYLKRLPIQRLKIDQSFIKDISTDADDRAIIQAVTALAHNMKLRVVAEGVETAEQLHFLESTGCDEAQGFFFHQPLPPGRFRDLLLPELGAASGDR